MGPKAGGKKESEKGNGGKTKGGSSKAEPPSTKGQKGNVKSEKEDASGGRAAAAAASKEKDSKASRKQREAEIERRRRQDVDDMMEMVGCGDDDEDEEEDEDEGYDFGGDLMAASASAAAHSERRLAGEQAGMTTDRFGNTISKAKKAEDERLEAMRREARERREAKARAAEAGGAGGDIAEGVAEVTQSLQKSQVGGKDKLTRKEKRRLQQGLDGAGEGAAGSGDAAAGAAHRSLLDAELDAFSLSVQAGAGGDGDEETLSATDVVVPCFSIGAPSRPLLVDAALKLVSGRRYGLLGPNGMNWCGAPVRVVRAMWLAH
jgi:hypothetical protein